MAGREDHISVKMMREGGGLLMRTASRHDDRYRPFAVGEKEGRLVTLETLYDYFINHVPDPDTALEQDPHFDEKLRQHPDVHAAMRLRELTVASMPARVEPSSEPNINRDTAQTAADYVEWVFRTMPNRTELYRQMQNAVLMGGQGHEWIWAESNGAQRPVHFYPIHKTRFVFDRLGNMALLTRSQPVYGTYVSREPSRMPDGRFAYIPPRGKFTYHKYMAEGGPWIRPAFEGYLYYGRGEDTNLYIPVTFDQFVLRFRMKWLEKHGMPLAVLYHPDDEEVQDEVIRIADSIRGESVVTIPRPATEPFDAFYALDFIDPPASGERAFADFSDSWTKPRIEKILLGGANLLEVGDRGSYAATTGQRDAGATIIFRYDALNIDETLNNQLIPYICLAKWPDMPASYFPKHVTMPEQEEDQIMKLERMQMAAQLVPVREDDVYNAAGIDKPAEGEEKVFLGQPQGEYDGFPTPPGQGGPNVAGLKKKTQTTGGDDSASGQPESPPSAQKKGAGARRSAKPPGQATPVGKGRLNLKNMFRRKGRSSGG